MSVRQVFQSSPPFSNNVVVINAECFMLGSIPMEERVDSSIWTYNSSYLTSIIYLVFGIWLGCRQGTSLVWMGFLAIACGFALVGITHHTGKTTGDWMYAVLFPVGLGILLQGVALFMLVTLRICLLAYSSHLTRTLRSSTTSPSTVSIPMHSTPDQDGTNDAQIEQSSRPQPQSQSQQQHNEANTDSSSRDIVAQRQLLERERQRDRQRRKFLLVRQITERLWLLSNGSIGLYSIVTQDTRVVSLWMSLAYLGLSFVFLRGCWCCSSRRRRYLYTLPVQMQQDHFYITWNILKAFGTIISAGGLILFVVLESGGCNFAQGHENCFEDCTFFPNPLIFNQTALQHLIMAFGGILFGLGEMRAQTEAELNMHAASEFLYGDGNDDETVDVEQDEMDEQRAENEGEMDGQRREGNAQQEGNDDVLSSLELAPIPTSEGQNPEKAQSKPTLAIYSVDSKEQDTIVTNTEEIEATVDVETPKQKEEVRDISLLRSDDDQERQTRIYPDA